MASSSRISGKVIPQNDRALKLLARIYKMYKKQCCVASVSFCLDSVRNFCILAIKYEMQLNISEVKYVAKGYLKIFTNNNPFLSTIIALEYSTSNLEQLSATKPSKVALIKLAEFDGKGVTFLSPLGALRPVIIL